MNSSQISELKTSLETILVKSVSDSALNRIVRVVDIQTADPKPEIILTCSRCGQPITAYGTKGVAFVTEYIPSTKYYHVNKQECGDVPLAGLVKKI